jgi:ABC-type lipoprotein export system ATPase subunit
MKTVFKIEDVYCSYNEKDIVLQIDSLDIKRGGIYFFIGASGIGKSTLLETLGLMNNTILKGSGKFSYVSEDGETTDLGVIWEKGDEVISAFRQKEYSFIFQNTNLMPHFSAGENMIYTMLIEGKSYAFASQCVKEIMHDVGLPIETFDRPIYNLSGGQRQRLAFVRAFVSEFNVLFGDEPTGNLDPNTAFNLMSILKNHVKSHNKTAIIVSHDIKLASNFADGIYCLTSKTEKDLSKFGYIGEDSFFESQNDKWFKNGQPIVNEISETLNTFL